MHAAHVGQNALLNTKPTNIELASRPIALASAVSLRPGLSPVNSKPTLKTSPREGEPREPNLLASHENPGLEGASHVPGPVLQTGFNNLITKTRPSLKGTQRTPAWGRGGAGSCALIRKTERHNQKKSCKRIRKA
jgi:hypothetical protein